MTWTSALQWARGRLGLDRKLDSAGTVSDWRRDPVSTAPPRPRLPVAERRWREEAAWYYLGPRDPMLNSDAVVFIESGTGFYAKSWMHTLARWLQAAYDQGKQEGSMRKTEPRHEEQAKRLLAGKLDVATLAQALADAEGQTMPVERTQRTPLAFDKEQDFP